MQYALEVRPAKGDLFYVDLPETGLVTVGREAPANVVLPDTFVSRVHFHLQLEAGRTFLTDLGSRNGTFVNGLRLTQLELKHGDAVRAGQSVLRLTAVLEGRPALKTLAPGPVELTQSQAEVLTTLEQNCKFAVLDGASDPAVRELLNATGVAYQSLYEGEQAIEVAPFGPFLVELQSARPLLHQLISKGWGNNWGIFIHAEVAFHDLRKHLRRLLTVQAEDGRRLLFRFYDPRVIRMFMPTCEAAQRAEFFGPVTRFIFELPDTDTLGFFSR